MKSQAGMTIIELVIIVLIITVLMGVGAAQLIKARARGNETSAVASLHLISSAQLSYSFSCGSGGFAPTLQTLAKPGGRHAEGFVPPEFSTGGPTVIKSGYIFTVSRGREALPYRIDCNGTRTFTEFYASARPSTFGSGGSQSFAVTSNGVVWGIDQPFPPTEPFGPPARPAR